MKHLNLSTLDHTWILDIDGTIVKHNGYWTDGYDTLLPGVKEFIDSLPDDDMIIFITARPDYYRNITEAFLIKNDIRYDHIIFDAPVGERILINDEKPLGLKTAIAVNVKRNDDFDLNYIIDENL